MKKGLRETGGLSFMLRLFFVGHHITGNSNENNHKDDTKGSNVHL